MASPTQTDFRHYSEDIVRRFLQTIMVVDDQAFFERPDLPPIPSKIVVPGPPANAFVKDKSATNDPEVISTSDPTTDEKRIEKDSLADEAHELDAKRLIGQFALEGIVCAVIRPKDEAEVRSLQTKVYPLAESCDIVVFDWVLHGSNNGEKVKEFITQITKNSSGKEQRLRLIVVYTGQEYLTDIRNQIKISLEAAGQKNITLKGAYTLQIGPVRIAVYAKAHAKVAPENVDLVARVIPIDEMPHKLISEFTDMTMGLVSNVAIASVAALRSNTHKLLTKFHPALDAAFLSHRAMIFEPGEADSLLVYLVGAEVTAILEGSEVSRVSDDAFGHDVLQLWLEMKIDDGFILADHFPEITKVSADKVLEIIRKGVDSNALPAPLRALKKNPHKKLTGKFSGDVDSASELDYQFAVLTSVKSDYRQGRPPILQMGTLLKESRRRKKGLVTRYWVCIQPFCDCVRLGKRTPFPFLPLYPVEIGSSFDLILPQEALSYTRVKIGSPTSLRMKAFYPAKDSSGTVKATNQGSSFFFKGSLGERYEWIADLKFEHAQRILNDYATTISRVGLDESEWLRRWSE